MGKENTITLEEVQREAAILELRVSFPDGYLTIRKPGARSPSFSAFHTTLDQPTLREAWNWLQRYRHMLAQLDQARSKTAYPRKAVVKYTITVWVIALILVNSINFGILIIAKTSIPAVSLPLSAAILVISWYLTWRKHASAQASSRQRR